MAYTATAKPVDLHLDTETAQLLMAALSFAADQGDLRIAEGKVNMGYEQPGRLRWLATYFSQKCVEAGVL